MSVPFFVMLDGVGKEVFQDSSEPASVYRKLGIFLRIFKRNVVPFRKRMALKLFNEAF